MVITCCFIITVWLILVFVVCGITKSWNPIDDPNVEHPLLKDVIGVAGEYSMSHGGALEPQITRLRTSDKNLEGLEIELHGGRYNDHKQKAVVSFICNQDFEGNEGNIAEEEALQSLSRREEDDDDNDDEDDGDKKPSDRFKQDPKSALQFLSYQSEDVGKERMDVLRLEWRTKHACEKYEEGDGNLPAKGGWGFFTWFILM